jgi:Zn finger protein HypA/HybF involved in hydrogenase expression
MGDTLYACRACQSVVARTHRANECPTCGYEANGLDQSTGDPMTVFREVRLDG